MTFSISRRESDSSRASFFFVLLVDGGNCGKSYEFLLLLSLGFVKLQSLPPGLFFFSPRLFKASGFCIYLFDGINLVFQ